MLAPTTIVYYVLQLIGLALVRPSLPLRQLAEGLTGFLCPFPMTFDGHVRLRYIAYNLDYHVRPPKRPFTARYNSKQPHPLGHSVCCIMSLVSFTCLFVARFNVAEDGSQAVHW